MTALDRTDELIALAALGELSADEQSELDDLATGDAQIAEELDDALRTAAMIQNAHSTPPPPGLRDSVLRAVASTPQHAAWDPPTTASVTDLGAERRRRRPLAYLAAAAALLLVLGVGSVFVFGGGDSSGGVTAVETADDAVARPLSGQLPGSLSVIQSADEGAIVVDGDGLPVLGANRVYVLWMLADGEAMPLGEFTPDADGKVSQRFDDVNPSDFDLGVTEETAGEVTTPTEPILAAT